MSGIALTLSVVLSSAPGRPPCRPGSRRLFTASDDRQTAGPVRRRGITGIRAPI